MGATRDVDASGRAAGTESDGSLSCDIRTVPKLGAVAWAGAGSMEEEERMAQRIEGEEDEARVGQDVASDVSLATRMATEGAEEESTRHDTPVAAYQAEERRAGRK